MSLPLPVFRPCQNWAGRAIILPQLTYEWLIFQFLPDQACQDPDYREFQQPFLIGKYRLKHLPHIIFGMIKLAPQRDFRGSRHQMNTG